MAPKAEKKPTEKTPAEEKVPAEKKPKADKKLPKEAGSAVADKKMSIHVLGFQSFDVHIWVSDSWKLVTDLLRSVVIGDRSSQICVSGVLFVLVGRNPKLGFGDFWYYSPI
ncbi:histone H2B-like [Helianthus annuus]|uniref:histone H2B-like n=1 Tax=Helianthus annuus TaxID=4232 RepID=UPI000B8F09C5|nr:histone H2B-like [Helianthus annuus]